MKLNQTERAIVVSCAAIFLLATADGIGMTWVCPTGGTDDCSRGTTADAQPIPAVSPSQQGISIATEGHVAKITSRVENDATTHDTTQAEDELKRRESP